MTGGVRSRFMHWENLATEMGEESKCRVRNQAADAGGLGVA